MLLPRALIFRGFAYFRAGQGEPDSTGKGLHDTAKEETHITARFRRFLQLQFTDYINLNAAQALKFHQTAGTRNAFLRLMRRRCYSPSHYMRVKYMDAKIYLKDSL